jgi:hypothetical protein
VYATPSCVRTSDRQNAPGPLFAAAISERVCGIRCSALVFYAFVWYCVPALRFQRARHCAAMSSEAVARFVYQAERQHGAALADVLMRAMRDSAVFFFGELLDLPSVQEVGRPAQ